ncbi:MAG TPA: tRNA 2-thiouridine(34) synthase MnmA [Woeseiaceae bacterium]|nr:tRNA 2-thiouridine(34) synthase MnmA [Woeseiaceae bacterium]
MAHDLTNIAGRKVILGLSGGVDSAVAAFLLREAGADVEALHMTNWEDDDGYCSAAVDLQDARRVCDRLGIPLHHVNFAKQYRERVFEYFLDEYRSGRTPNPDVLCNREIKFGVFRDHARRLGGELLATGHYARVASVDGTAALLKAKDGSKDQSYFLHAVSAEALADTVFPLGELDKAEVRRIARAQGLAVHDKKDSTGICFIGERPFREFLQGFLPAQPGPILAPDGTEVGRHHGLMYYTLGQRQGLGIGGRRGAGDAPWYVVDKDTAQNALIVDQGDTPLLLCDALLAGAPSWIGREPLTPDAGLRCRAKIRYRQRDQDCTVRRALDDRLMVAFDEPQRAAAPGQFIVFYQDDRCLGGAVIEAVEKRRGRAENTAEAAIS